MDDNGVLDIDSSENLPPWETTPDRPDGVIDGVGFLQWDDNVVPGAFDGHVLVAADLSADYDLRTFQPDNISRTLGDFRPNVAAAWFGGNMQGADPNELFYGPETFGSGVFGQASPGSPNGQTDLPPGDDEDGDGATNGEEAIAGTNPEDPTDYFRVTSTGISGEGVVLTWSSKSGKAYAIQYSTTLLADSWIEIGSMSGSDTETQFTDTDPERLAAPEGYYRIEVSGE